MRKTSRSKNSSFILKIKILTKYPIDFEIKNVCIPKKQRPTIPLNIATYRAPLTPNELLKITGNGKPYFWDGPPTKLANNATNIPASKLDDKTTRIFKS